MTSTVRTLAPAPDVVTRVRIVRTSHRPVSVLLGRLRPWRWQVTYYRLDVGEHRGVRDRAVHLHDNVGWAVTRTGARIAAARRAPVGG